MDDRYISLLFNADLYFSTHKFSLTSVGNHGNGVRLGSLTRSMDQYKPFNGRIRKVSEEIPGIKWYRVTCPEDCMESNPGVRDSSAGKYLMAGHWSPLSSAHPYPWESRTVL